MAHSVDSSQTPIFRKLRAMARSRRLARTLWALALAAALLAGRCDAPALAQEATHTVARGEQLGFIAQQYGVSLAELAAYNGITNPSLIYVGQQLLIPSDPLAASTELADSAESDASAKVSTYTVQRGDTLSEIAQAHGMSTVQLMELNGLTRSTLVRVGQVLRVAAHAGAAEPAAEPPTISALAAPQPFALSGSAYVVRPGETLSEIAKRLGTTTAALEAANQLPDARYLRVGQRINIPADSAAGTEFGAGRRWIEIDLADQTLTAWQGDVPVLYTNISSGKSGTPTVTGSYRIASKFQSQTMFGEDYYLPDVPWVMYFHGSYAIHGAYWHNAFGMPTSHGCINMRVDEARALYEWAGQGTEVVVH